MQSIVIDKIFNGPPDSGNGGYCCGRFAQLLDPTGTDVIEVTLRNPIPLETPLTAHTTPKGLEIRNGEQLIAQVKQGRLDFAALPAPSLDDAEAAQANYAGFEEHTFPNCFVCGPARAAGDGLCVFAGPLQSPASAAGPPRVAAVWTPYPALADSDGQLRTEFLWATLDCPSYFGVFADRAHPNPTAVLGRQTVVLPRRGLAVQQRYLVQAWPINSSGRKHTAAAALYSQQGECVAVAKNVWIEI